MEFVDSLTHILFFTPVTGSNINQAFAIAIKFVVNDTSFTCKCAGKSRCFINI